MAAMGVPVTVLLGIVTGIAGRSIGLGEERIAIAEIDRKIFAELSAILLPGLLGRLSVTLRIVGYVRIVMDEVTENVAAIRVIFLGVQDVLMPKLVEIVAAVFAWPGNDCIGTIRRDQNEKAPILAFRFAYALLTPTFLGLKFGLYRG